MEIIENHEIDRADITDIAEDRLVETIERRNSYVGLSIPPFSDIVLPVSPDVQFLVFRANELVAGDEIRNSTSGIEHLLRHGLGTERFPVPRFSHKQMIATIENAFFERLMLSSGERIKAMSS
jgi:hypothetical protein